MPPQPLKPLSALDPTIRNWIQSDGVFRTILELNKELGCWGEELSVVPQLIISLCMGEVKPQNFVQEIARGLPFLADSQAEEAAKTIKKKVFYPLSPTFKKYGLDIDTLSLSLAQPALAARETKMESPKPVVKPAGLPAVAPAKAGWQPTPSPEPKARVMEFAQMTDVKKPYSAPGGASQGKAGQAVPKKPEPTVSAAEKPFGLSETVPQAPPVKAQPSPAPKPPAPPKPSEGHELTKYQDEHPVPPFPGQQ
jgi:hypothetical protein